VQENATGILVTQNPALRLLRDHVVVPLFNLKSIQRYIALQTSELTINYRRSSLSHLSNGKRANVGRGLSWSRAPHAGDRVLPGKCLSYPAHEHTNLHQVLRGKKSHLLLFTGLTPADKEYAHLVRLASNIESLMNGYIKAHLVIASSEKPEQLTWNGSTVLDPQGKLHIIYGAREATLYVIRPDGYIGFRSQPVSEKPLLSYLSKLFNLSLEAIS
jgi:hypothetical protein